MEQSTKQIFNDIQGMNHVELTIKEENILFASFDLFLMKNPEKVDLLLKNPIEFIKEANEYHQKYISETISNENTLNAFMEYIPILVFNKINNRNICKKKHKQESVNAFLSKTK